MRTIRDTPPEIVLAAIMLALMLIISFALDLPVLLPDTRGLSFIGIHYIYPVLGIGIWASCTVLGQKRSVPHSLLIAFPAYTLVMWVHFNIKLWTPRINPRLFDQYYWATDQAMRPLVDASIWLRKATEPVFGYESGAYLWLYVAMFWISFCYHAVVTPLLFRRLALAAIIFQVAGTFAYLPFPAVGPFIFEAGANPDTSLKQAGMLQTHVNVAREGGAWLSVWGSEWLPAALGAMPSLHAGTSFLFLWFAWRHAKHLLVLYIPIFAYILVTAVAERWHYIVDLPVGVAIACLSHYWASKLDARPQTFSEPGAKVAGGVNITALDHAPAESASEAAHSIVSSG